MKQVETGRAADVDHLVWLRDARLGDWNGRSLLDLGCGSGFLCQQAQAASARHVVGVDVLPPDRPALGWMHQMIDLDLKDWHQSVARPATGEQGFDVILAFDILEHLSSPVQFLTACHKLLSSTGRLVLTTPNTSSWERWLHPETWSGATDKQHRILLNRYSLRFVLERCGFELETLRAPLRSLGHLAAYAPQIGGQMFCIGRLAQTK